MPPEGKMSQRGLKVLQQLLLLASAFAVVIGMAVLLLGHQPLRKIDPTVAPVLRGGKLQLHSGSPCNGSMDYQDMPLIRGEPSFPQPAQLVSLEWRTQRVYHVADFFGGSHSFIIFTVSLGSGRSSRLFTYRLEKSNRFVHICPNRMDGSCAFRSFDDGESFLSANLSDLRQNLNLTDWLLRAQQQSPEQVGYHSLEWNCHHFAHDLWNAAVGRRLQFVGIPNQGLLWIFRRLLALTVKGQAEINASDADDDRPVGEPWLKDHLERRRLLPARIARRAAKYVLRFALRKIGKSSAKLAQRRAVQELRKSLIDDPNKNVRTVLGDEVKKTAKEFAKELLTQQYDALREAIANDALQPDMCVAEYNSDELRKCVQKFGQVPVERCDDKSFRVLLVVEDPVVEGDDWREMAKTAGVTFQFDVPSTNGCICFGVSPSKFLWDGDRFMYKGKQLINSPRAMPFHGLQPAYNDDESARRIAPELCVGSSVGGACPQRHSCLSECSGTAENAAGSSESDTELSTSSVTQARQGDCMFTVHLTPRIGESLMDSSCTQFIPMKRCGLGDLCASTCCSMNSPPSFDGSSLDADNCCPTLSQTSPSTLSSCPWSDSMRCGCCDSYLDSSASLWSSDTVDCSGSCSETSFSSNILSWSDASPSSLGTSPFTECSCGVTASDIDCSGTFDLTGSYAAHKQCSILGEEGAVISTFGSWAYFIPRAVRLNIKAIDEAMGELIHERAEREREAFNAAKICMFSPTCDEGSSSVPARGDDAERCEGLIPEGARFKEDGDEDKWDCPYEYILGSEALAPNSSVRLLAEGVVLDSNDQNGSRTESSTAKGTTQCVSSYGGPDTPPCNCSETSFGSRCEMMAVQILQPQLESHEDESCESLQQEYCSSFVASAFYSAEHFWCRSSGASGCVDAHLLLSRASTNIYLQETGARFLSVCVSMAVLLTILSVRYELKLLLKPLLVLAMCGQLLLGAAGAIYMQAAPAASKRLYFAWCFSTGLPSEMAAHVHLTLQATVDLAYAKIIFAVLGLAAVCVQSLREAPPCFAISTAKSVVARPFRLITSLTQGCNRRLPPVTEKLKPVLVTLKDQVSSFATCCFEQPCRLIGGVPGARRCIKAGACVVSNSLQTLRRRVSEMAKMLVCQWACRRAVEGIQSARKVVSYVLTLSNMLMLYATITVLWLWYLQYEELHQTAIAQEADLAALYAALMGQTLPSGNACLGLNPLLGGFVHPAANGTLAQFMQHQQVENRRVQVSALSRTLTPMMGS